MGPFDNNPALKKFKAAQPAKPAIITKTILVKPAAGARSSPKPAPAPVKSSRPPSTGKPAAVNAPSRQTFKNPAQSRPPIRDSKDPLLVAKRSSNKRSSPTVSTPLFTSDDDESDEHSPKRRRTERRGSIDEHRHIRDPQAFLLEDQGQFDMIHSADIANVDLIEHGKNKYDAFFTALMGDEDEAPTIELQYPNASQRERYQLVRPTDPQDLKPLDEIMQNMGVVAEHYVDAKEADVITSELTGLIHALKRAAKRGLQGRAGAQRDFIATVEQYNTLVAEARSRQRIAANVDEMTHVPLDLVKHILFGQIYARAVSPMVHRLREYAGFSDNVYGELLPGFLSKIFAATHLKSHHVFVDLGSGVGNCVLQAALEIGCRALGCEMMANPAAAATAQAHEFRARCRLWGLAPGAVELIHDNFLSNARVAEVLRTADVVLINNQAFTPELNDKLKYKFLDLKDGCHIVSLKSFVDVGHVIKETNVNDPVNILSVERRDRFSGAVSWTDDPGHWFLHKKDGRRVERFAEKMSAIRAQSKSSS